MSSFATTQFPLVHATSRAVRPNLSFLRWISIIQLIEIIERQNSAATVQLVAMFRSWRSPRLTARLKHEQAHLSQKDVASSRSAFRHTVTTSVSQKGDIQTLVNAVS